MPDLLLELFSEEIPARMQRRAAEDLKKLVTDALVERGFAYEGAKAYATPRRLALNVVGLPAKGKDVREERKGPKVGAPEAALQGFLKAAGLASLDEARIDKDPKKGEFYVAVIERPGRPTAEVLAEILPAIVRSFPWPKSMRWGAASREPGSLRWVRPLHSIVCTFGPETETPEVVPFEVDGIRSGSVTRGHRFLAPQPIEVRRFSDYVASLERARVVLDAERRKDVIANEARNLAFAQGLELVEDEALLEEVAGLVEWPVVLMGAFEQEFLEIPPEVIRATIRANQKCFVLRGAHLSQRERSSAAGGGDRVRGVPSPESAEPLTRSAPPTRPLPLGEAGALANRFILVANLDAKDGGAAIVAGNERVVRARLADARFFFETDKRTPLENRLEKLKSIVFHEKLGTQYERVERIEALADEIAKTISAQPNFFRGRLLSGEDLAREQEAYRAKVRRAARLAKADLVSEMVGEFPELQGLMGRTYATLQGEDASVAAAIEEHYKPLGPSDRVPTDPVSVAVALADKLDTLVGFWAIDEKPTGSKDPYALRRAALGVIRLLLDNEIRIPLSAVTLDHIPLCFEPISSRGNLLFRAQDRVIEWPRRHRVTSDIHLLIAEESPAYVNSGITIRTTEASVREVGTPAVIVVDLLSFFADRLKVHLREQGARHDLIDAVFALGAPPATVIPGGAKRREGDPGAASASVSGSPSRAAAQRAGDDNGAAAAPPPAGDDNRLDDLLMIVRRVEALGRFLDTEDGKNLLAGYRRAANILRIEEKKDGRSYDGEPDRHLIHDKGLPEEKVLFEVLEVAARHAREHVAREDFEGAMRALAALRPAVDAFFDKVTVNTDDPALRENRLKLLNALRAATREVADFSRIEG